MDNADRLPADSRRRSRMALLSNYRRRGLGDINPSFIFSPKKSKVIWGVGPTFVFPTATNTTYLGQGKLSMGPAVVVLFQPPHFTLGISH